MSETDDRAERIRKYQEQYLNVSIKDLAAMAAYLQVMFEDMVEHDKRYFGQTAMGGILGGILGGF